MAAVDYCTRADVEAYTGIDFSDGIGPTDAEIDAMITDASRLIDSYAGKQLSGTESHTDWFDSTLHMKHLVLSTRPVVSVASVQTIDSEGVATNLDEGRERANHDWWLDNGDAGIIRFNLPIGSDLDNRIKVIYTAGEATVPIEAKMACVFMVARNAVRAALNDENCTERLKEMWSKLLVSTDSQLTEMLDRIKSDSLVGVAVHGLDGAYGQN